MYNPPPYPRPDRDPTHGPCGCFDCINAEADRDADNWWTVGVILIGFGVMLVIGMLIGGTFQ